MVSIDGRWGVAPKLGQSFRMVKCQFTQISFSVSCAYQKPVWQSLQWKGNTQGAKDWHFCMNLHQRGPTNPSPSSPITKSSQKNMDKKKWHLNRLDPLLSNNRLHPATSVQCPRKEYAGKYMPGSKGDKSEPKEANVVVFAAAEDGGWRVGRFPGWPWEGQVVSCDI